MKPVKNVDEYIALFPPVHQQLLKEMREVVHNAAPEAEEVISYMMPAVRYHGIVVFFGAFKNHISLFPTASGLTHFQKELTGYQCTKGSIHFPLNQPLPVELISKIVRFKVMENLGKKR